MAPEDCPAAGYLADYLEIWGIWLALVAATWVFFRATRGRTGRARLIAGNLLVLASLLWTAVVGAETYLRYVYDQSDQYGLTMTNRAWFRRHMFLNSRGFRDREFVAAKPPGVVRVACVGDSFTLGWGLADPREAWPQRIGAALEARTPGRFEIRNMGSAGWSTGDELKLVRGITRVDSLDGIILGYCLNDPDDLLPPDRAFDRETAPRVPWIRPTWSFVADFLWFRLNLRGDPRVRGYYEWEKEAYENPAIWDAQCARFREMADVCRAASVRLDVVVFPFFQLWGPDYSYGACHERVVAAWKKVGVNAVDLRDCYRGIPASELVVNRFDAHPSRRACEIASHVILERVFDVR